MAKYKDGGVMMRDVRSRDGDSMFRDDVAVSRDSSSRDGGTMVRESDSLHANLPTKVAIQSYPNPYSFLPDGMDDTIVGIDSQIKRDSPVRYRGFNPSKSY